MSEMDDAPKAAVARVADSILDQIMTGRVKPGARLPESVIAQELSVSRNTARGALALVEQMGLARYITNRGWVVWHPTEDDLMDVYLTRYYLEAAGARSVTPGTDFRAVEEALAELRAALDRGDSREIVEYDLRFHAAIVALAGSHRLNEFFERIALELRYSLYVLSSTDRYEYADGEAWYREHAGVFYGLSSGDPVRAEREVSGMIMRTREDLRRSIAEQRLVEGPAARR